MIHHIDDDVWTPKIVGECLVEAVRWARYAAGAVGPAGFRNGMPDLAMFTAERELESWPGIDELEPPRRPRAYSPAKVSQMERVLQWPMRYLKEHPGPTRVLNLWIRCKISKGMTFQRACETRGWSRATANRSKDKALSIVAQGLTADGIRRGRH